MYKKVCFLNRDIKNRDIKNRDIKNRDIKLFTLFYMSQWFHKPFQSNFYIFFGYTINQIRKYMLFCEQNRKIFF